MNQVTSHLDWATDVFKAEVATDSQRVMFGKLTESRLTTIILKFLFIHLFFYACVFYLHAYL